MTFLLSPHPIQWGPLTTLSSDRPFKSSFLGHLGGSVSEVSDFGSGHVLMVCEFEPCVGLCADSLESGACFGFCVSLSVPPMLILSSRSLSQK